MLTWISPETACFSILYTSGQMMELNSLPETWAEFKATYSIHSSLLRGFDAFALFSCLIVALQAVYAALTNRYPFPSLISSLCGALGLMTLVVALRVHLTPEAGSSVSPERAFVHFLISLTLLFWFVWNIMIETALVLPDLAPNHGSSPARN
jgi:hypothetical protein